MEERLQHDLRAESAIGSRARTKGLIFGLVASLIATIVIDLLLMGYMLFQGLPADSGFAVIGDTAAGFFARFGINVTGGVLPGVVWHYVIGLAIGALFGAGVTWIDALRLNSVKKGVGLGILYTEIISVPILVMPPIILSWTASEAAQSFGFFLVMHAIWGTLLGIIVSYGLRSTVATEQGLRAFANLLRMGHCAPTVMRTIGDLSAPGKDWLVRFSAGMPGGIGNTGHECGAVTSSLVLMGLRYGLRDVDRGLPVIFDRGHALCRRFVECHKTLQCQEIRGKDRFPRHCIPPIVRAPGLFVQVTADDGRDAILGSAREAYGRLYSHMVENDFHCAQAVFQRLQDGIPERQDLMDAASAFIGGTAFMGLTCSAFAAGVMALGLRRGEVENSLPRVVRMLAIMTAGGNALKEDLNKFNPSLMRGYRLSRWFEREFGSTQCLAITQCDFATASGVEDYVRNDRIARCRGIAEKVAARVEQMLAGHA
jgi:C_GCAxxG_C_C family probable redox protein